MLGMSRWSEKGGSYRTIQRFFSMTIPWAEIFWTFFKERLFDPQDCFLLAGDESIVTKAGKQTYGLDCFFSGLMKRAVPGLSFFTLALINTRQRRSYPIRVEQMIGTQEEKAVTQGKKQARKAKSEGTKRKPGRPKGSRNKDKTQVELNPNITSAVYYAGTPVPTFCCATITPLLRETKPSQAAPRTFSPTPLLPYPPPTTSTPTPTLHPYP